MKNKHKYFRNLRYKNKLENMYGNDRTYYSHVYFITKDVDPRNFREAIYKYQHQGISIEHTIEYLTKPERGKSYHVYWTRPEIDYSIVEYYTSPRRSKVSKFFKGYSNKVTRQAYKQKQVVYNHSDYKKQFDLKWTLD